MSKNKQRKQYSSEFREEALKLSLRIGVAKAARELGVYESQIYYWRSAAQKKATTSKRESGLAAENARLKRQLAEQAEELENIKKSRNLLREESKIAKYEFIKANRHQFKVIRMVTVLSVSRSGYYAWVQRLKHPSARYLKQQALDRKVKQAFDDSKQRDGARRIQAELNDQGYRHDVKTIGKSMNRQSLVAKAARKFKVTTNSNHKLPVAPNLLEQNFKADKANQKWAGDITYLYTTEGWLYLAVIIDLHSRAVIGWSMNTRMTADLVCNALQMALWRRGFPKNVIIHSDQGSQYCSKAYRKIIDDNQLQQSMSRKGNCWDNACVESFFHSLKVEAIQYERLMNRTEMREAVFEYIEIDYNRKRRHSALGYLSPEQYELKNVA